MARTIDIPNPAISSFDGILMGSGFAIMLVAFGFAFYFGLMMKECMTSKADLGTRMFVPWWPWLKGMLDEDGPYYRKRWLISMLVFVGGLALGWIGFWRAGALQ